MILRPILFAAVLATAAISASPAFAANPEGGAETQRLEHHGSSTSVEDALGGGEPMQGGGEGVQGVDEPQLQEPQTAEPQRYSNREAGIRALAGFFAEDTNTQQRPSFLSRIARAAACASGPCQ